MLCVVAGPRDVFFFLDWFLDLEVDVLMANSQQNRSFESDA